MARVISTLPNHSTCVNGIVFKEDRGQMISEDIPDEVAAVLATIPGYVLVPAKKPKPAKPAPETAEPPVDGAQDGEGDEASANPPAADEGAPASE